VAVFNGLLEQEHFAWRLAIHRTKETSANHPVKYTSMVTPASKNEEQEVNKTRGHLMP
jgi:hypothetical protein